ncbi:MAG: FliM/FliN family flagellar motor switch protein [Alkalilacustris sp.]
MAADGATVGIHVLRRKAAGGRPPPPEPTEPRAPRALRRALARAAQADCSLALAVTEVQQSDVSLAELLDMPEPRALLAVLEGEGERLGFVALGPGALAAIIEQQTTGAVSRDDLPARRPTRTDAAMCAALIDHTLTELEMGLAGTADLAWAAGFRYASFLDDPRPLGLLLEDIPYRVLSAKLELAHGARHGGLLLALPADPRRRAGLMAPGASGRAGGDDGHPAADDPSRDWRTVLDRTVMASPATLEAVLGRLRMPLAAAMAWKPGDFVVLSEAKLDGVTLEAPGGIRCARACLGQSRGQRALRLPVEMPGDPEL